MSDQVQKGEKDSDFPRDSFSKEQKGYVCLLVNALQRFYDKDANDLFEDEVDSIGECTMVGCIRDYVKCGRDYVKCDSLVPNVDTEYNKDHDSESRMVEKILVAVPECGVGISQGQCIAYDECWQKIDEFKNNKKPPHKFRPDLIIHRRGPSSAENDGMIVEFKKCEVSKCEKTEEIAFDLAKIRYCTCEFAHYKYKVGAFVLLKKTQADVFIFAKHKFVGALSVTAKGQVEVNVTQSKYEPLKKLAEDPSQETSNK